MTTGKRIRRRTKRRSRKWALRGQARRIAGHAGPVPGLDVRHGRTLRAGHRLRVHPPRRGHAPTPRTRRCTTGPSAWRWSCPPRPRSSSPKFCSCPQEQLDEYLNSQELSLYRHYLDNIVRNKPHTLSPQEEAILAAAGEMAQAPSNVFGMFNNADLKFPFIKDENGQEVEVTHGRYIRLMESKDRRVRHDAFKALHDTYYKWRNTVGGHVLGQRAQGRVLRPHAQARVGAARGAARGQRARGRVHQLHRHGALPPRPAAPLRAAAQEAAGRGRAAHVRSVRAAGGRGGLGHSVRGSGRDHAGQHGAFGRRVRQHRAPRPGKPLGGRARKRGQAQRRLLHQRVRRTPVHPDELRKQPEQHVHPGPRVRPRHPQLPGRPGPALRILAVHHLRGGSGVHAQRAPAVPPPAPAHRLARGIAAT